MVLELDNSFDIITSLELLRFSFMVQLVFSFIFIIFRAFNANFEIQIAVGMVDWLNSTIRLFSTKTFIFLKFVDFDACFLLLLCFLYLKLIKFCLFVDVDFGSTRIDNYALSNELSQIKIWILGLLFLELTNGLLSQMTADSKLFISKQKSVLLVNT
jgi:hypothetical protein